MGLFTTFKEFQKQPAISDVKKSKSYVCVSARIAVNYLLTSHCHEQNPSIYLFWLSLMYTHQPQKLDLNI